MEEKEKRNTLIVEYGSLESTSREIMNLLHKKFGITLR